MLHDEILDATTSGVFARLGKAPELAGFYLAGGTGLALQLGHRRSLDLDLFSERPWAWARITPALSSAGEVVVDRQEPGTFVGSVGGVRVSLFHYPYVLLGEPAPTRFGIPLASLTDIGCMKLVAVSQRGSRKDFIDLYYLAQGGVGIREILGALARKMPGVHYNPVHLIRALAYFDDAEAEPDPEMLVDYEWQAVKAYCTQQSRAMLDEIQDE